MSENNRKYRLFGWLNPIDVLIVAAIGLLIWGGAIFSAPKEVSAKPGDVTLRYTVELKISPGTTKLKEAAFREKIQTGAALYDSQKGYHIGTIVDVYAKTYRDETGDEAADIIRRAEVEGLENVYVVVEASAQVSDAATSIGQYELTVNKEVFLKAKTFAARGYVITMEFLETN